MTAYKSNETPYLFSHLESFKLVLICLEEESANYRLIFTS